MFTTRRQSGSAWYGFAAVGTFVALILAFVAGATVLCEYDRATILDGQWWRVITGHFVHWNYDHLFWDLLMFVVLGVFTERRDRVSFVVTTVVAALAISAGLWWGTPQLTTYRGLSGIDSALFALAAVQLWRGTPRSAWATRTLIVSGGVGFVLKVAFEIISGQTLFVNAEAAAFVPLPLVHAIGAAVGVVAGFTASQSESRATVTGQMLGRRDNAAKLCHVLTIANAEVRP